MACHPCSPPPPFHRTPPPCTACARQFYDSLDDAGQVRYQNGLSEANRECFEACDGIFTNYWWSAAQLAQSRQLAGPSRQYDVFVGVVSPHPAPAPPHEPATAEAHSSFFAPVSQVVRCLDSVPPTERVLSGLLCPRHSLPCGHRLRVAVCHGESRWPLIGSLRSGMVRRMRCRRQVLGVRRCGGRRCCRSAVLGGTWHRTHVPLRAVAAHSCRRWCGV